MRHHDARTCSHRMTAFHPFRTFGRAVSFLPAGWRTRRMDRSRSRRTPFQHRALALLGALIWAFAAGTGLAQGGQERWVAGGAIADQPATFILDTGSQVAFVITPAEAQRFGLQVDREPPPEAVSF